MTTGMSLSVDSWMIIWVESTVIWAWSAMITDNGIDFESLFFPYFKITLYWSRNYHFINLFFRADQLLLDDIAFWYVNLSIFCRPKGHHLSFFVHHKTFQNSFPLKLHGHLNRSLAKSSLRCLLSKLFLSKQIN